MNHIYVSIFVDKIKFYIVTYHNNDNEGRRINENEIILPISFDMGDKLCYIKKIIRSLIDQYNIQAYSMELDSDVGVEIIEVVKMEGVLEELFSCKGVMLWK